VQRHRLTCFLLTASAHHQAPRSSPFDSPIDTASRWDKYCGVGFHDSSRKASADNTSANTTKRRGRAEELAPFRWKPGQSGNPGGRPKSKPITDKLLEVLEDPKELEALVRVWLKSARKGSIMHLREILDRVEGRVALAVDVSGRVTHEMTDEEKARAREVLARMAAYDAQPLPPASDDAANEADENARD
jgi:hypothetical protein